MAESEPDLPVNQEVDAISPQNTTEGENPIPQSDASMVSEIPPSPKHQKESYHCRPEPTPRLKQILELGAFCLGIALALIYFEQLGTMNGQLREMRKATYISCREAQMARSTLLQIEASSADSHNVAIGSILQAAAVTRAVAAQIELKAASEKASIRPTFPIKFPMEIENIGMSAAQNVNIQSVVRIMKSGTEPDFSYPPKPMNQEKIGAFSPKDHHNFTVALTGPIPGTPDARYMLPMNTADAARYVTGDVYVSEYTRITYTDIFGVIHWLHHCEHVAFGRGRAQMNRYKKCGAYNSTDTNEVKMEAIIAPTLPVIPDNFACEKPKE